MERRPGVIPHRGRGVNPRFRSEGGRFQGGKIFVFLLVGADDSWHLLR